MSSATPISYNVVYDSDNGLRYEFATGYITVPTGSSNAITALTGDVTAAGPGSVAATIANSAITNAKVSATAAIAFSKLAALSNNIVPVTNGSGVITSSSTTATELGYVHGVTSAIQTQLGLLAPIASPTFTGTVTAPALTLTNTTNQIVLGVTNPVTITSPATSTPVTHTIPALTSNSSFIMTHGSVQQIIGELDAASFSSSTFYILGSNTSGSTTEISTNVTTGPRNVFIPEVGADANMVLSAGPQTLAGTYTLSHALVQNVNTLSTSGTITPVATNGPTFSIAVSGAVTLNGPSSGVDGQKVTFRIINDGSHSVALATGSGNFSFGTDITSYTNSVSLTDYIGAIWNASASRWHVVSVIQGF